MSSIAVVGDANNFHERVEASRPAQIVELHSTITKPTNSTMLDGVVQPPYPVNAAYSDIVNLTSGNSSKGNAKRAILICWM